MAGAFTIFILTWNLARLTHPSDLDLKPLLPQSKPDLIVIGLQEMDDMEKWQNMFTQTLSGSGYKLHDKKHMYELGMFIFVNKDETSNVPGNTYEITLNTDKPTGFLKKVPNKGATIICMHINSIPICFVNCHLNAGEEKAKRRLEDMDQILKESRLDSAYVLFWFGDMNFRLEESKSMSADKIINKIASGGKDELLKLDELTKLMSQPTLQNFKEAQPTFLPTYRFIVGTSVYDNKRRPAWTDRILYKDHYGLLQVQSYKSYEGVQISDHRPVSALFKVNERPSLPTTYTRE
ncbi:inositol polyphosphate 5-phosphatase K-like [Macrosteles quadrilineatus]|uniref:inositol polyphosphate 5-phosphatase K-like n=1 Tax=Macrosteles quadrilineatus TaxID=74068 RepID=UPI0023E260A4|nr:inositol polyphosphate 5-phosphatase K-like [Macrosteles quadrilineatus]